MLRCILAFAIGLLSVFPNVIALSADVNFEHVSSIHLGSRYQKIVERDGLWYLAGEWGLECWRFDEQDHFVKLSEVATPGIAQWVTLEGDYAYVADGSEGLTIINVTDPNQLRFVSNYELPHRHFPENSSNVQCVTARDGIVYASGFFGLSIIDAHDPYQPFQVDRLAFIDTVFGLPTDDGNIFGSSVLLGNHLFLTVSNVVSEDYATGLYDLDVSDPLSPLIRYVYIPNVTAPRFVQIRDSVLVVAANWTLHLFTIGESGTLVPRDSLMDLIFHSGNVEDLAIQGNSILLAGTGGISEGGITNIDISNLDSIYVREDFRLPTDFNCVHFADSIGFAGYFHSDLLEIRLDNDGFLDSTGFVGSNANVRGVAVRDDVLYATSRDEGLIIFDVSDRANPILLSRISMGDPLRPIVLGEYLCIGNIDSLARVLDITVPTAPQSIGTIRRDRVWTFAKLDDVMFALQLDSTYIYTLQGVDLVYRKATRSLGYREPVIRDSLAFGLDQICRILPDSTLSRLSSFGSFDETDFDVERDLYCTSRGYYGLSTFDVSNPLMPVLLASWTRFGHSAQPGYAASVRSIDDCVLLLEEAYGITIFDVSNPALPLPIHRLSTPGYALQGVLDSEYLYVADQLGIEIFRRGTVVDTDITESPLPHHFALEQNFPNPFRKQTTISFTLERAQRVRLTILNILGQSVRSLVARQLPAGSHKFSWDGTNDDGKEVASGIYFYDCNTDVFHERRKMILLR